MEADIEALAEAHGGYWGEHPVYGAQDWELEVASGYVRRGYWEWVEAQLANEGDADE
jgi:hypothetical protein